MAALDLRPLSLGEILDRTFSLYRSNFALFIGIAAIPQLLILAMNLLQLVVVGSALQQRFPGRPPAAPNVSFSPLTIGVGFVIGLAVIIVAVVAYLLSQGATVSAVADLYTGRTPTIEGAFQKVRRDLGTLFGVTTLNGLVVGLGLILLIVPGCYLACRLFVALPAAVIENLQPRASLERSFALTKGATGRAFLIMVLYFILLIAAIALIQFPASFLLVTVKNDPSMLRVWAALNQILSSVAATLVMPFLTIAASALYFDLRVRKEAFDLQMMMNPGGEITSPGGVSSVLS